MSKFDNMNKKTIPDPLTGGNQDVYTSKDGTFMMCIPDRAIPNGIILSDLKTVSYDLRSENKGNGVRVWTWEQPNKTEDAEFEIIQPKQISQ